MDEPLEEVNIYEFDDEEDNYYYEGKGGRGFRKESSNETTQTAHTQTSAVPVDIVTVDIEDEVREEERVEPVEEAEEEPVEEEESVEPVDEESTQEEYINEEESSQEDSSQEESDIYEPLFPVEDPVEETEWTIHSELLKTATNHEIIGPILGLLNVADGTPKLTTTDDMLNRALDNAIVFLVNIHVYQIYYENDEEMPLPDFNYADSNYQHNLDYIIELLKEKDDQLATLPPHGNGWVDQHLITNRMVDSLGRNTPSDNEERREEILETLEYFRTEITNQAAPIEQPTNIFNVITEAQNLIGFYNAGVFDNKDRIPRGTFLYGTLMDLITDERVNFKTLHKYIQDSRDYLLDNYPDDLEDIRIYNILDREMNRIIMIDRHNQFLKLIKNMKDLHSEITVMINRMTDIQASLTTLFETYEESKDNKEKIKIFADINASHEQIEFLKREISVKNTELSELQNTMRMSEFYIKQPQVEQPQVSSSGGGRKKIKSKRKRKLNKSKKKQRGGKKIVSKKRKNRK